MKCQLWYSIDCNADQFKRNESRCEAYLHFERLVGGETETLVGRGNSFAEARERVIALFKLLPPSEEIEIPEKCQANISEENNLWNKIGIKSYQDR